MCRPLFVATADHQFQFGRDLVEKRYDTVQHRRVDFVESQVGLR
jgi:hypothetical protein